MASKKRNTRKQKSKEFYYSETISYSSNPGENKPHGRRNIVSIESGKGTKSVEFLNRSGRVSKKSTRKLSSSERKKILKNEFIPGLWSDCVGDLCRI